MIFYNDFNEVPLKDGHRFPMAKYRLLKEALIREQIVDPSLLVKADFCTREELYLVHAKEYVDHVLDLTLPKSRAREVGLPLIPEMVKRSLSSCDAVVKASIHAYEHGFAASLCGGTHHASFDKGEGFCFFNDFALAYRLLKLKRPTVKVLLLDLDVHQGNGNAALLTHDPAIEVISFHGEKNYPFRKIASDLDISFASGTSDDEYLQKLEEVLNDRSHRHYDLLLYQAGVDPLIHDDLGHLSLSYEGLMARDELVFNFAKDKQVPLSMALGGGYSKPIDYTVEAYVNTYRVAKKVFKF